MTTKKSTRGFKALQEEISVSPTRQPILGKAIIYGGDYNDYNDYGNSFDESGYDLPGIVVTPGGNYPEDNPWDNGRDPWNDNSQDDEWGFDDFIGGNSYGFTTDKDYSNGIAVINAMNDSIKNGSALVVENFRIQIPTRYAICQVMPATLLYLQWIYMPITQKKWTKL